jgi:hypothetical protein
MLITLILEEITTSLGYSNSRVTIDSLEVDLNTRNFKKYD